MLDRSMGGTLFTSGLTQLLVIVSGVLVARSLGPENRGYFALIIVVSNICGLVASLGLPSAATYYIAADRERARRVAASLLWPGVLGAGVGLVLQAVVLGALVSGDPQRVKLAAVTSLLLIPGIFAVWYALAILQGQARFAWFNVLRTLPTASYVVAVLVLFLNHSADLVSLTVLWVMANFVGGFLALGVAARGLPAASPVTSSTTSPSRAEMTRFGLKSLFGSQSPIDAVRLDQIVVGLFLTPIALGFYVVAQAFTGLTRVVAVGVGLVAYPHVASQPNRHAARRAMWRYFVLGAGLSLCVVVALEIAVKWLVPLFFGGEFEEAVGIARILILAGLFMAARRVLTDGVNGLGHPGLGTIAEVTSWVLLIPALVICVPRYGAEGVALALLFAWFPSFVLLLALAAVVDTRVPQAARSRLQEVARLGRSQFSAARHHVAAIGLVVVAAIAAGIGVAHFGPRTSLVAVVAIAAVPLFAFARSSIRRATDSARLSAARALVHSDGLGGVSPRDRDDEFRLPRRVYYVGLLFVGLLTLRAGGQVAAADLLFLASLALACAQLVIMRRQVPIRLPALLLLGIVLFSVGGLISSFYSYEAVRSVGVIVRLIFLTVFWFWLGTVVLTRRAHIRTAMTFWVASAAISGGAAVLQVLVGDVIPGTYMLQGRATGFTGHPNDLGGLTAIALVPALMLAIHEWGSLPRRVLSYGCLFAIGAGLILSGSVGALIAGATATLVWFAFHKSSMHSVLAYAAMGLCVLAIIGVQAIRGAPSPIQRFQTVTNAAAVGPGAGSLDERVTVYRVAFDQIEKHPFRGVGLDLVSITSPFGVVSYAYDVHNLIIGTWYKAGLIGLAGLLTVLFAVFRSGWISIVRSRVETERMTAVALVASAVAFFVFAMSEPVLYSRFGWITAALILALRGVQERDGWIARPRVVQSVPSGLAPARP